MKEKIMAIKKFTSRISLFIFTILFTTQSYAIMVHLSSTIDLSGTPTEINGIGSGDIFNVFVLADNIEPSISSINGFEFAVNYDTASLLLLSTAIPAGAIDVLGTPNEFVVGLPSPFLGTTPEPVLLATLQFSNINPSLLDSLITIGPTNPSSFPGDNVGGILAPGDEIIPFSFASDLLVNQDSIPTPELYPTSVPEPSIIWLLGSGLALLGFARRKKS